MPRFCLILTAAAATAIRDATSWGHVTLRMSSSDNAGLVRALSDGNGAMRPVGIQEQHFLRTGDDATNSIWFRVSPRVNVQWLFALTMYNSIGLDEFASMVPRGFRQPGNAAYYAITHVPEHLIDEFMADQDVAPPEFAVWRVSRDGVMPLDIEVQPEQKGVAALAPHWPVDDVRGARMLVIGAGSIGGAAAHAMATAGIGTLHLLDPDRLRWHNLPRHVSGSRHVGRLKVAALRSDLEALRSDTRILTHPHDVVTDADAVRDLLRNIDVVVCATDGVLPRRVVSHLARRAAVPAVLACVLADGAYGDVMRLWPWPDHGCYQCRTDALTAAGGLVPDLERFGGYGTGGNAMTAVGSDLHLVGQFAAKMAVGTHLQRKGHYDQCFAGEHAVLALRPEPGWATPYNLVRSGDIEWYAATLPRPGCPTCSEPSTR